MDIETRLELITRAPVEEVITQEDLKELLQSNAHPRAYDGFEPSGLLHLASGIMRAQKIKELQQAGVKFVLWVADWFGWINNKMGGDLDLLKKSGEYLVEGWKACGVDMSKVEVRWTSKEVEDSDYWKGVIDVAKLTTTNRAIRAGTIMGRKEEDMQYCSQMLYPIMQAWDPFWLNVDILQLGMDQRHATMLTREIAPKLGKDKKVCVHHHLLAGLQGGGAGRMGQEEANLADLKMSKSKPNSCIFIHDTKEEIKNKLNGAYCQAKEVAGNPVLETWKYILFKEMKSCKVERPAKFGGNAEFTGYGELEKAFADGKLHPMDLKNATAEALDKVLAPIRKHFEKGKAKELYEVVKKAKAAR